MSKIVFRFKVRFEDVDDVERIIDASGSNSFRDLHLAIQDAIGFDRIKPASFFKANTNWRTGEEFCTEPKQQARAAGASLLAKHIDDPYQRFIYNYDPEDGDWTLRVEVIRLLKEVAGESYPQLIKSVGPAPKQYIKPEDIIQDPSAKLFKEADSLIKDLGALLAMDEEELDEEADDLDQEDDLEVGESDMEEKEDEDEDEFGLYGEEIDESEL